MNLDDSYFAVSKELEDGLHGDDNSKKKVKAYDNASRFMNGYAAVEINGKMYLVNEKFDICSEEFDGEMLFYNIQKHCYVVIEIKTRAFDPGDMGQLGTYIAATDGILRGEGDNQTIGLLICKTKDNVLAQYATSAINVPVGLSEYELNNLIPEDYKSSMPTIEEIERELKD